MRLKIKWYELLLGLIVYGVLLTGTILLLDLWVMPRAVRRGAVEEVPDVIGKPLSVADSILKVHHFDTAIGGTIQSQITKDYVAETDPQPGKMVKWGRTVKIFISEGLQEKTDTLGNQGEN